VRVAVVPGDKSIAHRFLVLSALAENESILSGVPASLDVMSTISCLRGLGVDLGDPEGGMIRVRGPAAWRAPSRALDCGNTGLLAGLGLEGELTGDASLCARPMDRVVYPLQAMGARISYMGRQDRLPVRLEGRATGGLRSLRYRPRVSSAQVRAALLLAALAGHTDLEIVDRLRPRDHTESILRSMGVPVVSEPAGSGERIHLPAGSWSGSLRPLNATVPGDLSSAAFLVVAALLAGQALTIRAVGLNPTRAGFLRVVEEMGAGVEVKETGIQAGEPVGDISVRPSELRPFAVSDDVVPQLIDEIPALVALASRVEGISVIRGAGELRVKESDRLALLASNMEKLGIRCEEAEEGLRVHGSSAPIGGVARTGGDHRIAMAFGALSASPRCDVEVDDRDCVNVSFPGFWEALGAVMTGEGSR
jgi:3-phosphoshikimate 1-carboxyvinyltransferase